MRRLGRWFLAEVAEYAPAIALAFPMFVIAMWVGMSRGVQHFGLFAIFTALATLYVAQLVVWGFRATRNWLRM